MKKIISIILALTIIISTVFSLTTFSVSADTNTNTVYPDYPQTVTLLDTSKFTTDDKTTTQRNSDGNLWLSNGAWVTSGTLSNDNNGLFVKKGYASQPILEYNNATQTNLTDFEWQFDIRTGDNNSASTAMLSFCFHVSDNSNVTSSALSKVLAVSLYGSGAKVSEFHQPTSLMVEYANGNNMRPVSYTYDNTNKVCTAIGESSYIDMSDFVVQKDENNSYFDKVTVNIKLVDNILNLSVWKTGNESTTKKTLEVAIPKTAFNNYTPSGDMAVKTYSTGCNMLITNMTVKTDNYTLNKGNASLVNHDWWGSYTTYEKNTSTSKFDKKTFTANYYSKADGIQLNSNAVADRLLAYNDSLPDGGVENFVWEFDYMPGRTYSSKTSFAFHVDDTTVTSSKTTNDDDGNVNGLTTAFNNRTSGKIICATIYTNVNASGKLGEVNNGIVIQRTGSDNNLRAISYSTGDYFAPTSGYVNFSDSVINDLTQDLTANGSGTPIWYSVRIVYYNNYVYVYMWKKSDPSTMFSTSVYINPKNSSAPTAGDFSIINAGNFAYINNMKITSLDFDGGEEIANYYKSVNSLYNIGDSNTRASWNSYKTANTDFSALSDNSKQLLGATDMLDQFKTSLTALETNAQDVNGDGDINICDLVALSDCIDDGSDLDNVSADPYFDGKIDSEDLVHLKKWILGLITL